jgi:hypothetical protein
MIYGLFELAFVAIVIGILTAPLWGKSLCGWMTRPFGAPRQNDRPDERTTNEP